LGRLVSWSDDGIRIKADPKHAEAIKKYCGLDDKSKGLNHPGKKPESIDMSSEGGSSVELVKDKKRITEYRGMAATANYLGQDRVDVQFAAKELCRSMSNPTEESSKNLKHFWEISRRSS